MSQGVSQGTFQVTQFYVNCKLVFESGDVSSDSFWGEPDESGDVSSDSVMIVVKG